MLSNNFYRDEVTLTIIEDAVKIRVSEPEQRALVKADDLRDLIEGLRLHIHFNKRLDMSLRTLVKNTHLLESDKRLFI